MSKKIHEKSVKKRTNAKQLLAEDADDIHFYEELKKRDSDKFLINGYHKNSKKIICIFKYRGFF